VSFLSIPPVIFGNAFVDRGFGMGEIIFIPPISLLNLSHHHSLDTPREGGDHGRDMGEKRKG
jgi:hypothetical protein